MKLRVMSCLLLLMVAGCGGPRASATEAAAVAAIEKLGGKVEFDSKAPESPVIKVYLHGTAVTDSDLTVLPKLTQLQNLFLGKTKISDAGLEHVKGASHLKTLSLNGTAVTDAGLKQLADLKELKTLNVQETKVTAAGVDELRRTLPQVTIAR